MSNMFMKGAATPRGIQEIGRRQSMRKTVKQVVVPHKMKLRAACGEFTFFHHHESAQLVMLEMLAIIGMISPQYPLAITCVNRKSTKKSRGKSSWIDGTSSIDALKRRTLHRQIRFQEGKPWPRLHTVLAS